MIPNEFLPEHTFRDMLDKYWIDTEDFPKPEIIVVNDADNEVARVNLNEHDFILVEMNSAENYRPRGNITYYDRVIPSMRALVLTKVSCQRVRNLSRMVRAIMFDNMHNFKNYQLIKPVSYREMVETSLNIWRADVIFQIEAHAVRVETLQ